MNGREDSSVSAQDTERQKEIYRLNARLRQQFAEYDMLMESTGVCIVKAGMTGGYPVEWCNEAAYRTIGFSKEEYEAAFGYDIASYFRGRETALAALEEAADSALQRGDAHFKALVSIPSKSGSFWAQCTGTFTDFDPQTGKPGCVYAVFTDYNACCRYMRAHFIPEHERPQYDSAVALDTFRRLHDALPHPEFTIAVNCYSRTRLYLKKNWMEDFTREMSAELGSYLGLTSHGEQLGKYQRNLTLLLLSMGEQERK